MALILFVGFILLLLINVPVAFALILASAIAILAGGLPAQLIAQKMSATADSFILLAVPFFLLAGHLMSKSGIARDIAILANTLLGWLRGGIAHATVGAGTLMGGMTGSAVAEASSVGQVMIPAMIEKNFKPGTAASVLASSSIISVVLPPSIPMIIYAVMTGTSVSKLFVAGIIPGILIAVVLMVVISWVARRDGHARSGARPGLATILRALRVSLWGLFLPLVIIGSIRYGIATPTEASVLAVAYALIVGMFVYGNIALRDLPEIVTAAAITTGVVMILIMGATLYGLILTREQVPQQVAGLILNLTTNPTLLLLLILVVYLLLGMILDQGAAIILLVPVLWPLVQKVGIDPIHFGIVTVMSLAIGLITPPVGASLFVSCGIARCNLLEGSRAVVPFVIALVVLVVLIILVPGIATWLPSRM